MKIIIFPLNDQIKNNFNLLCSDFRKKINGLMQLYRLNGINPEYKRKCYELELLDYLKITFDEYENNGIYLRFLPDQEIVFFKQLLRQNMNWKKDLYECDEIDDDQKLILSSQISTIKYIISTL